MPVTDYHAILIVHDLDRMDKRTQALLITWLRRTADEFSRYQGKEFNKVFAKRFRARLMK